jgi:MGT family glycosyltransferase
LFFLIPEKGHVNPYIGVAQALRDHGHTVHVHAGADISAQLDAAGLAFVGPRGAPPVTPHRGAAFAEQVRDAAWLRDWIRALLVDACDAQIEPLRAVIREHAPDAVVLDPMLYAAAIACELDGVPWAAISNSLNPALPDTLDSELLRTVAWLAPERAAMFARHGIAPAVARFRGCDLLSPHLTIAFTTRELVGDVPGVALVGPSLPRGRRGDETELPWDWLDPARPLVYASFGSQIYHQPHLFRSAIEAVAYRDVQLVISASELATSGELGPLPANVLARAYVPQLALLRRASVLVTHGGANSVMEAIASGVPPLIVPLCNDQFHQEHFVTRAGIGRAIDAAAVTSERIWTALSALIDPRAPERDALAPITASYARDGAAEAARLVSALAARNRPAPAS